MNDLLFCIIPSGGATKLGWRRQQLVCLSGVLRVMAVICWTGGSHGGLLLSHHLVPVTCHRGWYKSNPLCSGGLEKTNWCFKAQEGKCQRCSPNSLPASWGLVTLLGLNAEGSSQQVGIYLGANWKSEVQIKGQDKTNYTSSLIVYSGSELWTEKIVRGRDWLFILRHAGQMSPKKVACREQPFTGFQEIGELWAQRPLSCVSFWTGKLWQANGSSDIFTLFANGLDLLFFLFTKTGLKMYLHC